MRFYKNLHDTNFTPSSQQLLDVALILSILPHLFIIKPVMLLYVLGALVFLIVKKEIKTKHLLLFALLGGLALALSFYETLTFVGLKKLNIFVTLVISLLFVGVVLQRLSKQLNFYLLFSPALFLALSYFFYNTIMMLFYAVGVLFVFLVLLLWHRMQSSFMAAFKMSMTLFAFSIPGIVLLFLVFPRISFETKDFGFKASETIRTGHDGLMHLGGDALLIPSKRVVMEVSFDTRIPPSNQLYFRGSALYVDKTSYWEPLTSPSLDLNNDPITHATHYHVTLYPHRKKWLYFLDYPLQAPKKAHRDSDYIVTADKPVTEVMRYNGYSKLDTALHVRLIHKKPALVFDAKRDDKLFNYIQKIPINSQDRIKTLIQAFKDLNLSYSLQPKGIDENDPIDSFVFGHKQGYCVNFASTFATMARMMGIPSRIITGFKANPDNSYENYIMIREEDAHAWVEVYSEDLGWQRIETTQYAVGVQTDTSSTQNTIQPEITHPLWHRINLTYMYLRYTLQSWVLDYNRSKQMQILHSLFDDITLVLKFLSVFVVLGIFAYLLRQLNHNKRALHPALKALQALLKSLEKKGLLKEESESMEHFLSRCADELNDEKLNHVSRLYHQARYGDSAKALEALHVMLKSTSKTI